MMILELHRQGLSVMAIARRTGRDPKTVREYIERGLEPPAYGPRQVGRPSKLAPYLGYLRERVTAFPELSAIRLTREMQILSSVAGCSPIHLQNITAMGFFTQPGPASDTFLTGWKGTRTALRASTSRSGRWRSTNGTQPMDGYLRKLRLWRILIRDFLKSTIESMHGECRAYPRLRCSPSLRKNLSSIMFRM
jgi:hypothetical protein